MNIELDDVVKVTLSRRNLIDLVNQAQNGTNPFVKAPVSAQLIRRCAVEQGGSVVLLVQVEEDEAHYGDRTPGPGGRAL